MKNIYDQLNDINVELEDIELTNIEKTKMEKFAKQYSKKQHKLSKIISLAAVFLLTFTFMNPTARAAVTNFATNIRVSLMETIGASSRAEKYILAANKEISIGNKSFILEDLAIMDNKIFMNTLSPLAKDNPNADTVGIYYIKVNNKKIMINGMSGHSQIIGENKDVLLHTSITSLERAIEETGDINLELCFFDGNNMAKILLETSLEELRKDSTDIVENFEIPNSNGYKVDYININPITISAQVSAPNDDYVLEIIGKNKNNKKIQLDLIESNLEKNFFVFNFNFSDVSLDNFINNYKDFEFVLNGYKINKESGKETDDNNIQIGDSFKVK